MRKGASLAVLAFSIVALVCCNQDSAQGDPPLRPVTYVSPPAAYPFVAKVMTQNDNGIGSMTIPDMAKLVWIMNASGAPSGTYAAAIAAGMKTAWYQDPHRIGDVAGGMSDRPPITALSPSADLMKCGQGGLLNSTYSSKVGTYFGDPTSANLIRQSNSQLASAVAHYGPVSYLWVDDSIPITELWAQAWYCGNTPPALASNNGNGMALVGNGPLANVPITYAGGTAYTPQNYVANLAKFDGALNAPVLDEGACVGDDASTDASTVALATLSKNSAGIMCENFAEGWGNRQTRNGKAVDGFWKRDVNSGIRVVSAGKMFVTFEYIGNEGATNRGTVDDYDQRGYIYASLMLFFDDRLSVYKTSLWGAQRGVNAPVIVQPENLLVPLQPLTTAVWPQGVDSLRNGGVYVREFAACSYAGKAIGPCAAVVNPSSSAEATIPSLVQTYRHAISFTGNDGAFTGRHGTPNYGDTGDIDFTSTPRPSSLPPAGWAILVR